MNIERELTGLDIARIAAQASLADGYRFVPLQRTDIAALTANIAAWFPDISVGGASCYMRASFYLEKAFFADTPHRDNIVMLLKHRDEMVGMFACELDRQTQSVYASLGVAAPEHRGARLAQAGMAFTEELARHLDMGFVFGFATLKNPYAQRAFERAGWQLVGFTPGYDRELVAPGVVKRVFEAIFAKVLVGDAGLLLPLAHNLTPRTRALFDAVFPDCVEIQESLSDIAARKCG
jgi:hypothetical protein